MTKRPSHDDSTPPTSPPAPAEAARAARRSAAPRPGNVAPRCLDREGAADYLGVSSDTVERLIHTGALPIVRLPVERAANGNGKIGVSRRILIDVADLDRLIEASKETRR